MVHTGKFKLDGRADPPVVAGLQMSDPDRYVGHGSPLAVTSFCYSLFDDSTSLYRTYMGACKINLWRLCRLLPNI